MDMLLLPPPPSLRGQVAALWALRGSPTGRYSGLPKPCVELIISLSGLHFWQAAPAAPIYTYDSGWLTPLQHAPAFAETKGTLHLVGARLNVSAAAILFGRFASSDLTRPIALEELLGPEAAFLRERVALASSDAARLQILASWIASRLGEAKANELPCTQRLAAIGWRTDELADLLGLSTRGLGKRFNDRFGIGPKLWLQLSRFDAVIRHDLAGQSLADLAAAYGYADQAHMTVEFTRFAGVSPRRYALARRKAAAPDDAPHFVPSAAVPISTISG